MVGASDSSSPKIVVACDFARERDALRLIDSLNPNLCAIKIGKEMFTHFGPQLVKQVVERDFKVFLDLKFHDIPNTVAGACRAAADLGVWMLNVHASGGKAMMTAAVESLESYEDDKPLLIAVTILTSIDEEQYTALGFQRPLAEQVVHMGQLASESGLDGVVCSAQEASAIKSSVSQKFVTVTPGIRPAGSAQGDQSRVMTPERALNNGADYLVIGRPITGASNPPEALYDISESIRDL